MFQVTEGLANVDYAPARKFETEFRNKVGAGLIYPRAVNLMRMLSKAIEEAKSGAPAKIAAKLEGMKAEVLDGGEGFMRKQDHQFFQPMYISAFGPLSAKEPFDEEKTGWGWKVLGRVDTQDTIVPTTCKMTNRPS